MDVYNLNFIETWLDDVATCFVSFDKHIAQIRRNCFLLFFLVNIYIDEYLFVFQTNRNARMKFDNGLFIFFEKIFSPLSAPIFLQFLLEHFFLQFYIFNAEERKVKFL